VEAFFPTLPFAVAFLGVLLGGLVAASWFDLKTLIVPKKVTLGLAGAGLAMNLVRGAWLGAVGTSTWAFDGSNLVVGGLDGLLFGVCGLLVGFTTFFVLWIFGICGGGDVKLAAAVGAWLGPKYFFGVVALALPVVMLLTVVRVAIVVIRGQSRQATLTAGKAKVQWRLLSYSLPMTIAVVGLILIGFRTHLGL
jgi:Flp pilus assembly protein protease CpaA